MRKIKLDSFFLSLTGFFLFYLILYFTTTLRFETDDDVMMMLISSGYFSDSPDFHLVFINPILGYLIALLENFLPAINWYSMILVAILLVSVSAIFSIIGKMNVKREVEIALRGLIVCCFLYVAVRMQFTYVTTFACLAGILGTHYQEKKFLRVFGYFLFSLGCLLRTESAFVILIFFGVSYFLLWIKKKGEIDFKKVLIMSVIFLLIEGLEHFVYASESSDWKEYITYNRIRGGLNDNSQFRNLKDSFPEKFRTNKDQLDLLYNFFGDPEYMNLSRLEKIKAIVSKADKDYRYMFRLVPFLVPIVCLFGLFFVFVKNFPRNKYWPIFYFCSLGTIFLAMLLYANLNGRVNARAFFSASVGLFLSFIFFIERASQTKRSLHLTSFLLIVLSVVLLFPAWNWLDKSTSALPKNEEAISWIKKYSHKKIYIFPGSLNLQNFKVLENDPYMVKYNFRLSGWLVNAPFEKNIIKTYSNLLEDGAVLVVSNRDEKNIDLLQNVFSQRYDLTVKAEVIDEWNKISIIKFNRIKDNRLHL